MNRMKTMDVEEEIVSKSHRYQVEGIVGEGAYGVVLKCACKKSGEVVAIKKFKDTEDDETVRKTILREVKILRMLKHENIVSLLDAFRRKKRLYLVFEFLQRNLLQVLEEHPLGLEPDLIHIYVFQLVRAIRYCHQHEIVHRDIKPENLLVNLPPDPTLKLCDFGFARTVPTRSSQLTDYVATRWYRAPELLLGLGNYGKAVDIWAIGCIMGELIDAQPLFPGESDIDQLFVIRKVLGPLTEHQREMFLHNPRFLGMKLPEIGRPETLHRRYHSKITKSQLLLMKGLLEMDERQRFSIEDAYETPYFSDLRESQTQLKMPNKDESNSSIVNVSNDDGNNSNNSSLIVKTSKKSSSRDFVAESINSIKVPPIVPHSTRRDVIPSRNPPITPPLITHDPSTLNASNADTLGMTIQRMETRNSMDKDNVKRKRRDLRSRGANDMYDRQSSNDRALRSRHIKHRKKKHRKHRHHSTMYHKSSSIREGISTLNINNTSPNTSNANGKDLDNNSNTNSNHSSSSNNSSNPNKADEASDDLDYEGLTPRAHGLNLNANNSSNSSSLTDHFENSNNSNSNNGQLANTTSLASIETHSVHTHNHSLSHYNRSHAQYGGGHTGLPNVSNTHHLHSRTISRRGNKPKQRSNNLQWGSNRRPTQQDAHHGHAFHGLNAHSYHTNHIIRDTQTTGGEPISGSLNSSRIHYNSNANNNGNNNGLNGNALPQLGRVLTELPKQNNDVASNNNGNGTASGNNADLYSGRNHHLRSRKSDRRTRVPTFGTTEASPRMYGGSYKQRNVGFTFARYQHQHSRNHR